LEERHNSLLYYCLLHNYVGLTDDTGARLE
jgi:hypothetical protein